MANSFIVPKYIVAGEEALKESISYLKDCGKKAFIVTDKMMVELGSVTKVIKILDEADIEYSIFSEVNSEPTDKIIIEGINEYKLSGCDFLIGLGGGSPIDAMKAIGAMITNNGDITDYVGKVIEKAPPKLVAIPTTAGTGSEATQFTIISDTQNGVKMLLKGSYLMPSVAIIDPIFTLTAPKNVTAATGVDALTHAIEAYTSRKAQPLSDTMALSAIKRIYGNLLKAYSNGSDLKARGEMAIAALEAGIAFNNASVTLVHGMSRPIGALFHVPHGLSNAMLLKECLEFAKEGAVERFCDMAKAIGIYKSSMTLEEGAEAFLEAIKELLVSLNIDTLEEFGVEKEEFFEVMDKMAEDALISGSPQNTRRSPSKKEIIDIYKALWN
ncbi:iron-containing alcohol dehydrogenase [Clostridium sp. LP20]|uniref:iron-containing alcohol dehydrogenase n=1 Tax=Clostridium sp. LP20 TaxID=3418665 RepID=UPI003EE48DBB